MGGSGSGRWRLAARTVESCAYVEVKRRGLLNAATWGIGWQIIRMSIVGQPCINLRTHYESGPPTDQFIGLSTWKPRFGGESIFLLCPTCGRRCRKLYAPRPTDYRCRVCWKLAYISSQEAHKWDRGRVASWLAPWFAAQGISMREVEKAMRADFKAQREAIRRGGE